MTSTDQVQLQETRGLQHRGLQHSWLEAELLYSLYKNHVCNATVVKLVGSSSGPLLP